ncbi:MULTISPECIES: hypothetical protein [Methanocalculus]|uniref:hypothetical protein n=1 Tax=Methanocalculus TaxID=71151 RepID=UPI0020A180FD|nr:hypothetical protein [Methanocalculus sp. AMF5]MCP1662620.1 signal peptidase I [Methanocalculus sp. AMF5]
MSQKSWKLQSVLALILLSAILGISATATASMSGSLQSTAKGDSVFIEGYAYGSPDAGVAIWIFGRNFYLRDTQHVEADAYFSYELTGSETLTMAPGQYFVVVQHPMRTNRFDVIEDTTTTPGTTYVRMRGTVGTAGTGVFTAEGPGRLQGTDAAEALVRLLDNPNIDDTYMRLSFILEEPWITIDPIDEIYTAERFIITGQTNLAAGSDLIVEISGAKFGPMPKAVRNQVPDPIPGTAGVVTVIPGDAFQQRFFFEIDYGTLPPDDYTVSVESVKTGHSATATFTVIEEMPKAPEPPVATPAPTPAIPKPETPAPKPEKTPLLYASFAALFVVAVFGWMRR